MMPSTLANIGLPMILLELPLMLAALVPIIVLEATLARRYLPLSNGEAFRGSAWANTISTIRADNIVILKKLIKFDVIDRIFLEGDNASIATFFCRA